MHINAQDRPSPGGLWVKVASRVDVAIGMLLQQQQWPRRLRIYSVFTYISLFIFAVYFDRNVNRRFTFRKLLRESSRFIVGIFFYVI